MLSDDIIQKENFWIKQAVLNKCTETVVFASIPQQEPKYDKIWVQRTFIWCNL